MSRCHLERDGGDYIVIGWDPGPATFFCIVQMAADGVDAEPRLWLGALPGDVYDHPTPLIEALEGMPEVPSFDRDRLQEELLKDQAADDAKRVYSL